MMNTMRVVCTGKLSAPAKNCAGDMLIVIDPDQMAVIMDPAVMIEVGWLLTLQSPPEMKSRIFGPICMACAKKQMTPEALKRLIAVIRAG